MARIQLVLIKEEKLFTSISFLKDEIKDDKIISLLEEINNEDEFDKAIKELNNNHYNRRLIWEENYKFITDMRFKTFEKNNERYVWRSDYMYIKNATNDKIKIIDYMGEYINIEPNSVTILLEGKLLK